MRYAFISAEKANYPLTTLCRAMQVARSGYYRWATGYRSSRELEDERVLPLVRQIFIDSKANYGSRTVAKALGELGLASCRDRARRLMRIAGLSVKKKSKWKSTTDSRHNLPVFPNLLMRDFKVSAPNRAWAGDITYIWTAEGWLHLAVVLDLFSRRVVGWSLDRRMKARLVMGALEMALWRRRPAKGLVFHSDQGSQYASFDFQQLLANSGIDGSMSRKGDPYDNAVVESFFSRLKSDRVRGRSYHSREEATRDIVDYIEMYYNSNRLHSSLGYVSPKKFEERWLEQQEP